MPIGKPREGESQTAWMARCMHELGKSETDRPQDQMVAICLNAWRSKHPGAATPPKKAAVLADIATGRVRIADILAKQAPEPKKDEDYHDFMTRCKKTTDEHACETKWNEHARAGEKKPGKWEPSEHSMRVEVARVISAWKKIISRQNDSHADADVPEPDEGEHRDDFLERCTDALVDQDIDEDEADSMCNMQWEGFQEESGGRGIVRKKDDDDDDGKKPYGDVEYADPGYQKDGKKRYPIDTEDHIRSAWNYIHKPKNQEPYTSEQVAKIKGKIIAAWKKKIDSAGPPSAEDDKKAWVRRAKGEGEDEDDDADVPKPKADESREEFMARCQEGFDEDECKTAWDEENGDDDEDEKAARGDGIIHKQHVADSNGMAFVLSDATPDRFGDVVEPKGWEYKNFLRHPIALFNHNPDAPIGKWSGLRHNDKDFRGRLILAPEGTSPRIDEIRKLVEADILKAVSVGFKAIKSEPLNPDQTGRDPFGGMLGPKRYLAQELVECSLVSIPANPNALAVAKSLHISSETQRLVFGKHADKRTGIVRRGEDASDRRTKAITG